MMPFEPSKSIQSGEKIVGLVGAAMFIDTPSSSGCSYLLIAIGSPV